MYITTIHALAFIPDLRRKEKRLVKKWKNVVWKMKRSMIYYERFEKNSTHSGGC